MTEPKKIDISIERARTYHYAGGAAYTIINPVALYIVDSGGHRVVDTAGITHCPAQSWVAITWTQKDGKPFAF